MSPDMQLFINLVTILVLATWPLVQSLTPLPKVAATTPDQLFNCTSYRSNFCIGMKDHKVSINHQGCIKDQNCEVLVHIYRSQDYFTFHYACARPDCVIIFLIHYNLKIVLKDRDEIKTFDQAKASIPRVPFAVINLMKGEESVTYYREILFGFQKEINGYFHLRGDKRIDSIGSHQVGQGIRYKVGGRWENDDPSYDWDKDPFSVVLIHSVNNQVKNLVDGMEPMVLFSDNVQVREQSTMTTKSPPPAQENLSSGITPHLMFMIATLVILFLAQLMCH